MCRARNAIASSDTLRCSESTTKRGQRVVLKRRTSSTPSTTAPVSSISATTPVERVMIPRRRSARPRRLARSSLHLQRIARPVADAGHTTAARLPGGPAGPARAASRPLPAPRTSVAVAAMFASAQLAAATLTVRQVVAAGLPVRGSMMWCIVSPRVAPATHGDARRGKASGADRDRLPGRARVAAVIVGHVNAPAARRAGARRGDVAADAHKHAAAARARGGRGGSDQPPTLSRSRRDRARSRPGCAPSAARDRRARSATARAPARSRGDADAACTRWPAGGKRSRAGSAGGHRAAARRAGSSRGHSRPARAHGRRWDRRRRPSARAARTASSSASISSGLAGTKLPAQALTRDSSESSRKRLQARSIAVSSRSTLARARAVARASVSRSETLVPSASQLAEPGAAPPGRPLPSRGSVPSRCPVSSTGAVPSTCPKSGSSRHDRCRRFARRGRFVAVGGAAARFRAGARGCRRRRLLRGAARG